MFLIRHSIRTASLLGRPALSFTSVSRTCIRSSSSSSPAGPGHDSYDSSDVVTMISNASEVSESAEMRKAEVLLTSASSVTPKQSGPQAKSRHSNRSRSRPPIASGTKEYLRFVRIFGLSADMTLADILEGIAQTAPVGRVLHIEWDKQGTVNHRGMEVKGALVLFDHDAAAADLVRLAKQRTFVVCGESVFVSIWSKRAFHSNDAAEASSRVLQIYGPRDVEDFSEEGIRNVIMGNDMVAKALGPLGLDAEAVVATELGGGKRLIELRFFSHEKQAKLILFTLRRVFYRLLSVRPGPDPCWNERLYPRDRTGNRDARYLPAPAPSEEVHRPSKRAFGRVSGQEDSHHALEKRSTRPKWERSQIPWETAQREGRQNGPSLNKIFGRHNNPVPLNKRQQERISAWTQISQFPKTDAPHDHERDDRHQRRRPREFNERQKERFSAGPNAEEPQDGMDAFEHVFKEALTPDRTKRSRSQ